MVLARFFPLFQVIVQVIVQLNKGKKRREFYIFSVLVFPLYLRNRLL